MRRILLHPAMSRMEKQGMQLMLVTRIMLLMCMHMIATTQFPSYEFSQKFSYISIIKDIFLSSLTWRCPIIFFLSVLLRKDRLYGSAKWI